MTGKDVKRQVLEGLNSQRRIVNERDDGSFDSVPQAWAADLLLALDDCVVLTREEADGVANYIKFLRGNSIGVEAKALALLSPDEAGDE